jgi:hypothetical protein
MPEIVRAAAEPFAHVGQMTVLNGAEGLNGMVAGIIAQVGTLLPQLTSALGRRDDQPAGAPASQPATNGGPASLPPPSVTPPQDVANAPAAQR